MRILYIGAVDFSAFCLREVLKNNGNVIAIITLSSEYSTIHSDFEDLTPIAREYKIPIYYIKKLKDAETIELVRSLQPDIIFIFGFSQLIPPAILNLPSLGCIGTHPALLPRNRGRHPLIWALVEGLSESGLTFLFLDEGVDSGDILWQKSFPITLEDDASTLYSKIKSLAQQAIPEIIQQLESSNMPRIPQNHSKATYWRKRTEQDGVIHWDESTLQVYNLIRALTHPYIGAHTYLGSQKLTVWQSKLADARADIYNVRDTVFGCVVGASEAGILVKTRDGFLELLDWEPREVQLYSGAILKDSIE